MKVITEHIDSWLELQTDMGRAPNTVSAYQRALQDYAKFSCAHDIDDIGTATREHFARYVYDLLTRPVLKRNADGVGQGLLANATVRQRMTAVRLFYDYLCEESVRLSNPVGKTSRSHGHYDRHIGAIIPAQHKMPRIPTEPEWRALLEEACSMPLRNRLMLALAYDAGLRREELCLLKTDDIDPSCRLLHIRAETTKSNRDRVVPYSACTGQLLREYLKHRRSLTQSRGVLFISESPRNKGKPITFWTWSKVVKALADSVHFGWFSTHTLRHLCLTDLARSGWDLHEIASFAGHRNTSTTMIYIHLSGRELAAKFATASQSHVARIETIRKSLLCAPQ
jgi:integrase/recombinase XerD